MKIHVRAFPECVRPLSRESAKFSASDSSDVSEPDDKSESSSDDSSSSLSSSSLFPSQNLEFTEFITIKIGVSI